VKSDLGSSFFNDFPKGNPCGHRWLDFGQQLIVRIISCVRHRGLDPFTGRIQAALEPRASRAYASPPISTRVAQAQALHLSAVQHPGGDTNTTTMPSSDYAAATGGALKLKGGAIDKKKKKKKPKPNPAESTADAQPASPSHSNSNSPPHKPRRSVSPSVIARTIRENGGRPKTDAERRHEEMRRKRLEEKVRKEGVKTHKEKVEELNKYLSGLSEHHDMPKIGPG